MMPRNSAGSMFGGAGGRGARVSVASLEGLRSVMRNDPGRDSAAPGSPGPAAAAAAAAPLAPADDKKTMRGLNDRLSGYLGRVRELEKANKELEDKINEIMEKRGTGEGRDWDEIEKPLADLRKKLRDMTMNNAKLLLQIDNSKLANDDFKNKLDVEHQGRQSVEQDLTGLKKIVDDTHLNRTQLESQIDSVKEELALLKKDHKDETEALRKKIKESTVVVEVDSQDPAGSLANTLNKIRGQYEKLAKKNLKETEDWYQSKFDNIKVEVSQNTEALQSGNTELNDMRRQRQQVEIDIQAMLSTIRSLEETLMDSEGRYGHELGRLNQILRRLEGELGQLREQVERQAEDYQDLLQVKMKLEAEIDQYRDLLKDLPSVEDRPAKA
ncbi:keratin, type I cytoskeletal 18 isoform 2-T2 [Polymixia lowei]